MIAYAARTGTQQNLVVLRRAQWRLLVSAAACLRTEDMPYALDNGAWSYYCRGKRFDDKAFVKALRKLGAKADWTTVPDIVAGGKASLELSLRWLPTVLSECAYALIAVQDGLIAEDIAAFLGERVGIFVGGSTAWKLATLAMWGYVGRQQGCWVHVGRVNTARRIDLCQAAGVTSFDGSSVSRYAKTLPLLDNARRQLPLFVEEPCPQYAIGPETVLLKP